MSRPFVDPEAAIAVLLWFILCATLFQTWLLHKRLPVKKKPGRKKKAVVANTTPVHGVKRHRAVTAEEIQPRE